MTDIFGGSYKDQLEHEHDSRAEYRKEELEAKERTAEIIAHTELATKTKAIYVDGKLHYIPVDEAKRLELL